MVSAFPIVYPVAFFLPLARMGDFDTGVSEFLHDLRLLLGLDWKLGKVLLEEGFGYRPLGSTQTPPTATPTRIGQPEVRRR